MRVEQTTWATEDRLVLIVRRFEIATRRNLLEDAELFGLATAQDDSRGHFPAISNEPLAIGEAVQQVRAAFTAEHFEAAAVMSFALLAGAAVASSETPVLSIQVAFGRPFGFIAFHRPTRLALVAGWVAEPPALDTYDAQGRD